MEEDLLKFSEDTRYQFLKVELQLLSTGIEMGLVEFDRGNLEIAQREAVMVKKGIETIERLLPQIAAERRLEVGMGLAALRATFEDYQAKLAADEHGAA